MRLLGTASSQISDEAMEASAGAWVRGRSPGRSEGLQSCLEACLPHSVLVGHGHGPALFSGPSQPRARTFGISGGLARTTFTFRRNFPPVAEVGTAGKGTGGRSVNFPLTGHVVQAP